MSDNLSVYFGHIPTNSHYVCIYIYIYIWVNYNDLTATSLEIIVSKGNDPHMAEEFRLVKYYNLPIYIYILQYSP